ncbi:hypothetical protein [Peribacillus frigoritolerans]|uniref:Uncharacterized protein n=1 Tax=Peribacillus castrilensis TaxID=2897690 RepID=A0AAW9N8U7_9BACI|nr:hypothetical protein [Peribacillus castrilensis]
MKNMLSIVVLILLIGLGFVSNNEVAFAGTMEYSVKANIPKNQVNKNSPILT